MIQVLVAVLLIAFGAALMWTYFTRRFLSTSNTQEQDRDREFQAIRLWREKGPEVWEFDPLPLWAIPVWKALEEAAQRSAYQRVCSWCSKTEVPQQVVGILDKTPTGGMRWYCCNKCYREGHGYES